MEKNCAEISRTLPGTVPVGDDERSQDKPSVSVFGLGYVGAVTAACLAQRGFCISGIDSNPAKVQQLRSGVAPIVEKGLPELIGEGVRSGRLGASEAIEKSVAKTDISLVCVGTPSLPNGDLDLTYVRRVCEQIGAALRQKSHYHVVVLRSTVLPGTTEEVVLPILEEFSGKRAGEDFGLCFNPEFLREGSSVQDFHAPPFTLIGSLSLKDAEVVRELYGWLEAEVIEVDIRTAEMIKYVNNSYHALKVTFANEIGRLCAALGMDSHRVMEIFCKDTKQNLSPYYLKPGYAFGGSCLPKDLRAMLYKAKSMDVPMEVVSAILTSNRTQTDIGVKLVEQAGSKRVGQLGLAFKSGADDLRESPLVALAETLYGRGYDLKIFDANVSLSRLTGANRAFIDQELPHIGDLLHDSLEHVIDSSDVIVIGTPDPQFQCALRRARSKKIIDLVRIGADLSEAPPGYRGIGW